jgi:hypothetical protein
MSETQLKLQRGFDVVASRRSVISQRETTENKTIETKPQSVSDVKLQRVSDVKPQRVSDVKPQREEKRPEATYVILIDVECSIPGKYISEICALGCLLQSSSVSAISEFHRLVSVPKLRTAQAAYVYKNVTGLSYQTLSRYGQVYEQVLTELSLWLQQFDVSVPIYARDPTMEMLFLGSLLKQQSRQPIQEVCTLLMEPYRKWFMKKTREREACCIYAPCLFHAPVSCGHSHCAKKDVWDMTQWICIYSGVVLSAR